MFSKKTILLIFLQLSFLLCKTQQVNFIKYTVYDGLVANPVRCIYQDSKGFIWIGTLEGLSRYDGYRFTNYTASNGLSHNFVNSFFEIDGKLLIAENNGAIDVMQNNSIHKGLTAASAVNIISPYKDRLLVSSDGNGFYEYKNDTIILPAQEKTGISLGHFIPLNDSFLLSDGVNDHLIIYRNDLSVHSTLKIPGVHFYSLFRDSKNRVWACTSAGLQFLEFNPRKKSPLSLATLPRMFDFSPLNNPEVTSMLEDKDGSFWIGTSKGLVHIFPGGDYQVYEEKDGLPSAHIHSIHQDRENNLWIGTTLGLAKWVSKNNVTFYNSEHNNFKADVYGLYVLPEKKIIVNTLHGLQQFDFATKDFKEPIPVTGHSYLPVTGTYPLLVYSSTGIGVLDEKKNTIRNITKLDSHLVKLFVAYAHPSGTILLVSQKGLYAFRNSGINKLW